MQCSGDEPCTLHQHLAAARTTDNLVALYAIHVRPLGNPPKELDIYRLQLTWSRSTQLLSV